MKNSLVLLFLMPFLLWGQTEKSIHGFVRNADNGEVLSFANVFLQNTTIGTTTNKDGYFVLSIADADSAVLMVTMMGYADFIQNLSLQYNSPILNIRLQPQVIEFGEIIKTAERERFEREVEISHTTISARQLYAMPMLAEADVMRTLQLLPGVVRHNDFSSQLYVRGGSPDQNLILLDGATVYNPFHLFGLFSTFNTDAIKDVEFVSGGFSAEYGGRLSSVLNITNNAGNSEEFQGKIGLSLLSAKATIQGPIPHGSYLFSIRRTYFDQIFKHTEYAVPYYFYDMQGKINLDLSNKHRLTFSTFYGKDLLTFRDESESDVEDYFQIELDWHWGNRTFMLNWRWILCPDLYLETRAIQSKFDLFLDMRLSYESDVALNIANSIQDYTLQSDFNYFGIVNHALKFGVATSPLTFGYAIAIDDNSLFDYLKKPSLTAAYIQDQFTIDKKLSIRTGLRYENYSIGRWHTFSPRIGVKYKLYPNFAINGSAGIYHQFLTAAYSDDSNFSFFDLWFPITEQYKPQRADHIVAGIEWWLPHDFKLTTEIYYKNMRNLLELNMDGNDTNPSDDFFTGNGNSWGMEFLLKRSVGNFNGWAAFTICRTQRTINGQTFFPKYDRRHNLNLVANYNLGRNWLAGMVFTFGSGMPYTPVIGKYYYHTVDLNNNSTDYQIENIEAEKNSERYPVYHRLDLSIRKKWQAKHCSISPYLQVVNIYNRKNVLLYFWDNDSTPSKLHTIGMFPLLPTLGVDIEF